MRGSALESYLDSPMESSARRSMPTNVVTALDYCLRLYMDTPLYRAVTHRAVSHFVTRLMFRGEVGSSKERETFEQFFIEELAGLEALKLHGDEFSCYGNGFLRVHFPFTRVLVDHRNNLRFYSPSMFPEELVEFNLQKMVYRVPDPTDSSKAWDQRKKVELPFRDTPSKEFSKIRIRQLDPRFCKLRFSETAGACQVQYSFSPETRSRVQKGALFEVNRTPKDMLMAIRDNVDFLFEESAVHHLKRSTISGISNEGWGLPEILAHYPSLHRITMMQRVDDVFCREYLTPFRVLAPNLSGMTDMASMSIAAEWIPASRRMMAEQKADPSKIHAFPYPVTYQELGGPGKEMVAKELREFEVRGLFNSMGMPMELYESSLQLQQIPTAVRLFESSFGHLSFGLADACRFLVRKISAFMYGEAYDATLVASSVADDLERRSLLFNLYSAGDIPARVAFDSLKLDRPTDLKVERAKDDLEIQRRLAVLEKEEQIKSQMGSIDDALNNAESQETGGAGSAGGAAPVTPLDMRSEAEALATQWLGIPSDGERAKAMRQVQAVNPDLYAVAKDVMEQIRSQGASQGRQMAAQQYQQ